MMKTPNSLRVQVGIFGKMNAGKSSLINALTGNKVSIVSDVEGTTTDTIKKAMEIPNLGPVAFIDTPGFDDETSLKKERQEVLDRMISEIDFALFLFSGDLDSDLDFIEKLKEKDLKIIYLLSKADKERDEVYLESIKKYNPIPVSVHDESSVKKLLERLEELNWEEEKNLTGNLVNKGDLVYLVVTTDIQAPKGRLILPQVQMLRDILDKEALGLMVTLSQLKKALINFQEKPDLIITDSQIFKEVHNISGDLPITSFSVLMSKAKGDVDYFIESVKILDTLEKKNPNILIAEACSHSVKEEDIGRVKIPGMIRRQFPEANIKHVRGSFLENEDLDSLDLIIHCGNCIQTRRNLMNKVYLAKENNIPMTNYGVFIAYSQGILDDIVY